MVIGMETNVLLGYSERDITPTASVELIGFSRPDNMSKGVLRPLISQVLLWINGSEKFCLVTVDSIGFSQELTNGLRDRIAGKLNVDREKIMVCFSHTHSAPNASANPGYYDFVCNQVLSAVGEATENLSPVKAVWGVVEGDIGINRRDGGSSLDQRIGILKITDALSDQIKVTLLRVTAHANVLTSDNYSISPDYFGTTRDLLEKEFGCKVMLTQGAAGNIKPKYRQTNADFLEIHPMEAAANKPDSTLAKQLFDESIQALDKMAVEIYNCVNQIISNLIPQPIQRLAIFSDIQSFSADVPTMEKAAEVAAEAKREAGIDGMKWLTEVERLRKNLIFHQDAEIEIQYFCVNDGCLCGIANEAMCELALDILHKTGDKLLFFGAYTNGCNSYLPSAEEYDKGGYEVLWSNLVYFEYHGRVMPLKRDTASRIADIVAQRWKEYR
jgi:hypothetical protein